MSIAKKVISNLNKLIKESLEDFNLRIGDSVNILTTEDYGSIGKIISFDDSTNLVTLEVGAEARRVEVDIYDIERID